MPNDGQHRSGGNAPAPGEKRGMQSRPYQRGSMVGQENGPEANMRVGTTQPDDDISTTTGSAGPLASGEKPGADDK